MLYECFTTWSDEIVPHRGAFFTPGSINADGKEHFISIVAAVHPPAYGRLAAQGAPTVLAAEEEEEDSCSSQQAWGQHLALTSLQPLQLALRPGAAVSLEAGEEVLAVDEARAANDSPAVHADALLLSEATASDAVSVQTNLRRLIENSGDAWSHLDAVGILCSIMPERKPPPTAADLQLGSTADEEALGRELTAVQRLLIARVKRQAAAGGVGAVVAEDDDALDVLWAELREGASEYRNAILSVRLADLEYLSLVKQVSRGACAWRVSLLQYSRPSRLDSTVDAPMA